MRVPYEQMVSELQRVLIKKGFGETEAFESAELFAKNSLDGVYTHGLNRFPRTVSYIEKGYINPNSQPEVVAQFGAVERWDGKLAMGNLNAKKAMERAIALAGEFGIGIIAMGNTNHWMRGGCYGWQAADAGCIGVCWTNTIPNMPVWGGTNAKIGNNPFVISIPRENGEHVVIDTAMAQYSYGKIEQYRLRGMELPLPGGYDTKGELTRDPAEIEATRRVLPIGYWKGSGMSLALDLVATVLGGGWSATAVGKNAEAEYGLSQIFIAMDPEHFGTKEMADTLINEVLEDIKTSELVNPEQGVRYPGESSMKIRKENSVEGIPVVEEIWNSICEL